MTWKAKAHPTVAEVKHAYSLLPPNPIWKIGVLEESGHIQYRGAMHPNYEKPGEHPGVEVWTDIPQDQFGYMGEHMAEDLGTSSLDEIETVLAAVEAVSNYPRDEVYSTIMIESGWKPHNYYHSSKVDMRTAASGLIGFMPATLYALGWEGPTLSDKNMRVIQDGKYITVPAIDMREFRKLSTAEQSYWVAKYFDTSPPWKYPGDTYVATAAGGYVGRSGPTTVYKNDPNKQNDAWDLNKVWDINKDEVITVEELRQVLLTRMKKAPSGGTVIEVDPKAPPGAPGGASSPVPLYFLALDSQPSAFDVSSTHLGRNDSSVVRIIQSALKDKGLYKGRLDGDHGPLTEAAIKRFLGQ